MKARFRITYDTVTEASAEHGETAHNGFLPRSGNVPLNRNNMPDKPALFTLKQAVDLLQTGGSSPIEADSCPVSLASPPRWFNCQITQDWERPSVRLSLHLGEVSPSSAMRIARLFRCYGLR